MMGLKGDEKHCTHLREAIAPGDFVAEVDCRLQQDRRRYRDPCTETLRHHRNIQCNSRVSSPRRAADLLLLCYIHSTVGLEAGQEKSPPRSLFTPPSFGMIFNANFSWTSAKTYLNLNVNLVHFIVLTIILITNLPTYLPLM